MDQDYASHEEEPPFENENNKLPKIPILTIPIVPDYLTITQLVLHVDIFSRNWISREKDMIYIQYYNICTIYARQEHFVLKIRLQNQPSK